MTIAENLKRLRIGKSLSQPELAAKSGVSQQLISQIENGKNGSTKHLPRLADALGVSVAEIDPSYGRRPVSREEAPAMMQALFTLLDDAGQKEVLDRARELVSRERP